MHSKFTVCGNLEYCSIFCLFCKNDKQMFTVCKFTNLFIVVSGFWTPVYVMPSSCVSHNVLTVCSVYTLEKLVTDIQDTVNKLYDYSFIWRSGVGTSSSSQWDFWGSTLVTSQYVRLTPDERSKQGSIWNTVVSKTSLKN